MFHIKKTLQKIMKQDITKFIKYYKYTLTVEETNFDIKGRLLLFGNIF